MTRNWMWILCLCLLIGLSTACDRPSSDDNDNNPVVETGPDTTPPSVPQGFDVRNNDDSLVFSWQANSESDIAGYEINYQQVSSPNSDVVITLGLVTSYELHDLTNNTEYEFRIRAVDSSNNFSPPSSRITETPVDISPPDAPRNVDLDEIVNDNSAQQHYYIKLTWTNPDNRDFQGVRIVRKEHNFPSGPEDGIVVYQGVGTSFQDFNVQSDGTFYYYRLYSFDEIPNYSIVNTPRRAGRIILP